MRVIAYRKCGLAPSDVGLDPAALDAARAGGTVVLAGSELACEELGEAIRDGRTPQDSLAVRTWLLVDEEKRQVVRIEKVGGAAPQCKQGILVAADAIEVVRLARQ
jgi:hypothetical protein